MLPTLPSSTPPQSCETSHVSIWMLQVLDLALGFSGWWGWLHCHAILFCEVLSPPPPPPPQSHLAGMGSALNQRQANKQSPCLPVRQDWDKLTRSRKIGVWMFHSFEAELCVWGAILGVLKCTQKILLTPKFVLKTNCVSCIWVCIFQLRYFRNNINWELLYQYFLTSFLTTSS